MPMEIHEDKIIMRAGRYKLQRDPSMEMLKKEGMSYEELEIDRDRMKTARDTLMLQNANLKSENYDLKQRKPWVGLTHEELCEIVGVSTSDSDWNVVKVQEWLRKVEAKLREKNT